jgi:hypothetical protein
LQSDYLGINALDRIVTYYQPTGNMPGNYLPLLLSGLEYPNGTNLGNKFDEDFELEKLSDDDLANLIIAEEPEEHEVSTELRKFYPYVVADQSKYGKLMTVSLNLDFPVRIELVNDEIKHISFVYNLIDIISESEGVDPSCVILNSFRFFDKSYKGQKNGHTGEVEDIIPKLEDAMDDCRSREVATTFSGPVITLSFLIQP